MQTLNNSVPLPEGADRGQWRERLDRQIDRWTTAPALQRWASASP